MDKSYGAQEQPKMAFLLLKKLNLKINLKIWAQ